MFSLSGILWFLGGMVWFAGMLLGLALCKAAARGDRMSEQARNVVPFPK